MNSFKVCIALVLFAALAVADPVRKQADFSGSGVEDIPEPVAVQPRVTCDLLGPTGWGDALCAAHCIAKGHSGGYCDSRKVCTCR
ncbi:U-Asilidin(12)-Dg3b-like [Phlebotomus argentipes]|uniref:U-Asilidin(12)-Dg3b-like n=1 Tax=Phlebotomus argentipes TaxID=94469 RepID=UPI0028937F3F|nr:U-Asilidin(12)-Dg3b-like [Phlebotomus argentipes]